MQIPRFRHVDARRGRTGALVIAEWLLRGDAPSLLGRWFVQHRFISWIGLLGSVALELLAITSILLAADATADCHWIDRHARCHWTLNGRLISGKRRIAGPPDSGRPTTRHATVTLFRHGEVV